MTLIHKSLLFSHELGLSGGWSSWRLKVITAKGTLIFTQISHTLSLFLSPFFFCYMISAQIICSTKLIVNSFTYILFLWPLMEDSLMYGSILKLWVKCKWTKREQPKRTQKICVWTERLWLDSDLMGFWPCTYEVI